MDELSINPDVEFNTSDTTFEIDGYGESVDAIQEAYESEPFKEPLEEQEQEVNQLAVQKQQESLDGTSKPISTQAKVRDQVLTNTGAAAVQPEVIQPGEAIAQGKLRTGAKRGVMRLGPDGLILDEDLVDINGRV